MPKTIPVLGVQPAELDWVRTLVTLLRHPDPVVPELTRQALRYLENTACRMGVAGESTAPPPRSSVPACGA